MTAGGLWAGSEIDSRPKYRDEQTLVGGTVWSQVVIPIGLIISSTVDEELYIFVHAYFLFTGFMLLGFTGVVLVYEESKKINKREQSSISNIQHLSSDSFDKIYFAIGVLSSVAALITLSDFIYILI
ncbi:hypothetical protein KGM_201982 [Danaus plexippus plexippus]|uniref:Uncharacterized protein n=1 Tax=Danaus plexippus plexippus TaxID=278856 RepID=A0A212EPK3_DANPL|nr:hypothetical protein KGM_201982 [Danaus plexippus plexippus]